MINKYPYTDFNEYNLDWCITRIRDLSDEWAATHQEWEDVQTEWKNYKDYIDNYFATLDLSQEVSDKIDQMASDGYFENLFNTLYRADIIAEAGSVTSAWIADNLLQETGYVIDASLTVANAAADAKATGDYVHVINSDMTPLEWTVGKGVAATGAITTNTYCGVSSIVRLSAGDWVKRTMAQTDANNYHLLFYVAYYDQGSAFIRRDTLEGNEIYGPTVSVAPADTYFAIFTIGRSTSSGITFTSADIAYFSADVVFKTLDRARASQNLHVEYTAVSASDDHSEEQLYVTVHPSLDKTFSYYLGRCIDSDKQLDTWRLMYFYKEYPKVKGGVNRLTTQAEWECAVHLNGASDFSGGFMHGSEIMTDVQFFTDGKQVNDLSTINGDYREFRIVRKSTLYNPDDDTDIIGYHGCEYIFTNDGLTLNQSIKWVGSRSLTHVFLGMYPPRKSASPYRYDNMNVFAVSNPASNYSDVLDDGLMVTEYNGDFSGSIEKINMYPEGLTGQNMLITDNQGLDYNKVYVRLTSSASVETDDIFYNSVKYTFR